MKDEYLDDKKLDKVVAGIGSGEFAGLPMEELIKGPIIAAKEAEKMLKRATSNFFEVDE